MPPLQLFPPLLTSAQLTLPTSCHRHAYAQSKLGEAFTHSKLLRYTEKLLDAEAFTHSKFLHTASFCNAIHDSQLQHNSIRTHPQQRGTLVDAAIPLRSAQTELLSTIATHYCRTHHFDAAVPMHKVSQHMQNTRAQHPQRREKDTWNVQSHCARESNRNRRQSKDRRTRRASEPTFLRNRPAVCRKPDADHEPKCSHVEHLCERHQCTVD